MAKALPDIVLGLAPEDLRALSSIAIERGDDGEWWARLSICRIKHQAATAQSGVALLMRERVADQYHRLAIDELERDRSILSQARALEASRIIGHLDMARLDRADRSTSYIIKSHAGSQQERNAWLIGLSERPEIGLYEEPRG